MLLTSRALCSYAAALACPKRVRLEGTLGEGAVLPESSPLQYGTFNDLCIAFHLTTVCPTEKHGNWY
jgi:hypothetical protein